MSDPISPELFARLALLAAFDLPADEAEYLRKQLNNQLKAVRELEAIPLAEGTEISPYGVPFTAEISSTPREDEWVRFPRSAEILAQAPETDDGYIIVPEIPHTELS